jgi:hypothetical protein
MYNHNFTTRRSKTMSKKKKLVMVEAIQQYRMRYVVELDADAPDEHALDTVVCEEDRKEFSQLDLGETIISHRKVGKKEFVKIFKEDNEYLKNIANERCFEIGLTQFDENDNIIK